MKFTPVGKLYSLDAQNCMRIQKQTEKSNRHHGKPGNKPMKWKYYPRDRVMFRLIDINDGFA